MHPSRLLQSVNNLRTRLFVSFAMLVLLALVMAAGVFVALHRNASDRETLDRVAATVSSVSFELRSLYDRGAGGQQVSDYLRQAAHDHGVRILLVDQRDGSVVEDSGASLRGRRLDLPDFGPPSADSASHFASWRGTSADTKQLTFFAAVYDRAGRPFTLGRSVLDPGANLFTLVAVPRETVANAWLGLLPGLLWAGLAALALSALMAILLSRSIAHPVLALTRASEEMARGNFDQEVPLARTDEIGRLALAFNTMAREVGRSYLQTRALIANVSHDLKTPLTSILGFAQALQDGAADSPEEIVELSGIIHEEAQRILAIVEDLLYLSQLEAGEVALQRVPVKLEDVAARCLRRLDPVARERNITVASEVNAGVWVLGDAGKLERVLDNLLDNAGKYTPTEGEIALNIARSEPEPPQAIIRVRNSGSYISPAELDRVFDRFYRSDPSRGSTTGGTGLGLAIVKDLVRLQHGMIVATSSPEAGTTFEVRLPLAPAAVSDREEARIPAVEAWSA
ncbi:MAG TPA: HAMP domain-containing sensor histidine kinase [Dehalococcoidia bacterium]|nr:HAMP domain-containing sensor histidine kinase [Dehalococcoidia bacterium]